MFSKVCDTKPVTNQGKPTICNGHVSRVKTCNPCKINQIEATMKVDPIRQTGKQKSYKEPEFDESIFQQCFCTDKCIHEYKPTKLYPDTVYADTAYRAWIPKIKNTFMGNKVNKHYNFMKLKNLSKRNEKTFQYLEQTSDDSSDSSASSQVSKTEEAESTSFNKSDQDTSKERKRKADDSDDEAEEERALFRTTNNNKRLRISSSEENPHSDYNMFQSPQAGVLQSNAHTNINYGRVSDSSDDAELVQRLLDGADHVLPLYTPN